MVSLSVGAGNGPKDEVGLKGAEGSATCSGSEATHTADGIASLYANRASRLVIMLRHPLLLALLLLGPACLAGCSERTVEIGVTPTASSVSAA